MCIRDRIHGVYALALRHFDVIVDCIGNRLLSSHRTDFSDYTVEPLNGTISLTAFLLYLFVTLAFHGVVLYWAKLASVSFRTPVKS